MRIWILPRYFSSQELSALDAPTASAFTLESVGGAYGAYEYEEEDGANPAQSSSGTVNEDVAVSDSDDASVLERGDAVKMKRRRRSSAVGSVSSGGRRDSVQGSGTGGAAPGPQIRKGRGVGA